MRVDKFLKVSRIIKRRTIANEACDAGRVMINGKVVKAGAEVKIGDVIEIQFGNNTTKIEVLDLKESTKKEDAVNMYRTMNLFLKIRVKGNDFPCGVWGSAPKKGLFSFLSAYPWNRGGVFLWQRRRKRDGIH